MTIEEAISKFVEAQRYVRRRLYEAYSIPEAISATEWTLRRADIKELHAKDPTAKVFRPHGYGLEFKDHEVHVDFDFCQSGRIDGFDAWRIFCFCDDNNLDCGFSHHSEFDSALKKLEEVGVVEKEENLYFMKQN